MSDIQKLKQQLTTSKTVVILLPSEANKDIVAAGLSLYLSLIKAKKQTSIIAISEPIVRDSHLVGLDKISQQLPGNNLVITVNLPESAVDKVTSNTDGGHLNLILTPPADGQPITQSDLSFSTSGAFADLIIVLGANSLTQLQSLTNKEPQLFQDKTKLVNISNQAGNFGSINLTDLNGSNSELVTALLNELKLPLDKDIANNLMQGIEEATQGLSSPKMTADTFEALAVLYRAGARRIPPQPAQPTASIVNNVPLVNSTPPSSIKPTSKVTPSTSPDWLKPKIYKGSSSIPTN